MLRSIAAPGCDGLSAKDTPLRCVSKHEAA
jgi:hypothetical protein